MSEQRTGMRSRKIRILRKQYRETKASNTGFQQKKPRAEDAKLAKSSEVEEPTLVFLTFGETNPVTDAA